MAACAELWVVDQGPAGLHFQRTQAMPDVYTTGVTRTWGQSRFMPVRSCCCAAAAAPAPASQRVLLWYSCLCSNRAKECGRGCSSGCCCGGGSAARLLLLPILLTHFRQAARAPAPRAFCSYGVSVPGCSSRSFSAQNGSSWLATGWYGQSRFGWWDESGQCIWSFLLLLQVGCWCCAVSACRCSEGFCSIGRSGRGCFPFCFPQPLESFHAPGQQSGQAGQMMALPLQPSSLHVPAEF